MLIKQKELIIKSMPNTNKDTVIYSIIENVKANKNITVTYHSDADGICSAIAFALLAHDLNPYANVNYLKWDNGEKLPEKNDDELLICLDIAYGQVQPFLHNMKKVIVIDHHTKGKNKIYNVNKKNIQYIDDGGTATDLVLDITTYAGNDKRHKDTLLFLSDVSRTADGLEELYEHTFDIDWNVKYGLSKKEFHKLSRLLTHIASDGYEKHEQKLLDFLNKNKKMIKGHIEAFDELIDYDNLTEDVVKNHDKKRKEHIIVNVVHDEEIPNAKHVKGIIAENISKELPDTSIIVHRHDKDTDLHKISVRNRIPTELIKYIEKAKESGEKIDFGGRDGAWAGEFTEEQFKAIKDMLEHKNEQTTIMQKGYLWKKYRPRAKKA